MFNVIIMIMGLVVIFTLYKEVNTVQYLVDMK
jgi:hypothetical protein